MLSTPWTTALERVTGEGDEVGEAGEEPHNGKTVKFLEHGRLSFQGDHFSTSLTMDEAATKEKVQTFLTSLWSHVQARQAQYLAARGRFCQGKHTHAGIPADGSDIPPDRTLSDKPTDQTERWGDVFTVPAQMPCSLVLDTYDGPTGKGFVLTAIVRTDTRTFRRSRNHGPETWRTTGWVQD